MKRYEALAADIEASIRNGTLKTGGLRDVAPGPIFSATRAFTHCLRFNHGHPWDAVSERVMQTPGRLAGEAS